MYQRRRVRIVLGVLTTISLILISVDFRSGGAEGSGPFASLRAVASAVFGPVQDGLANVVRPVGNALGDVGDVFSNPERIADLEEELEASQERRLSYAEVLEQNEELRELLGIVESAEFEVVAAQVTSRAPSNLEFSVGIDVGGSDGIERDMAVINGQGLVGRVVQVTENNARVLLAIDPTFGAAARVAATREIGTLSGAAADPFVFEAFDDQAELETGQELVTSTRAGGLFPNGIPIGTIEDAGTQDGLVTRRATVTPFVDFTRLDFVLVVTFSPDYEEDVDPITPEVQFTPPPVEPFVPLPSPSDDATTDGPTDEGTEPEAR